MIIKKYKKNWWHPGPQSLDPWILILQHHHEFYFSGNKYCQGSSLLNYTNYNSHCSSSISPRHTTP